MKVTAAHQSEYSPTALSAFFTSFVLLMLLSTYFCFSIYRSQAAGNMFPAPDPQTPMTEDHYINIPYFTESGGMSSTLTLNNNEAEAMSAKVTIFNQKGDQFAVPPIILQPVSAERFSLKDLTATAKPDFNEGSIQILYHGTSMGITSQVSIVSSNHHLAFESVETEAMDFASTSLNGIAWIPDHETKARLALTNTTVAPLQITVTGNEKVQSITLRARENRVINLEEYLHDDSRATLITLDHHGPLGALIATGFALNEETGFSTNLNFVDCATAKASRLAAAHVRFGRAGRQEGFPAGTSFRAPLVIANTMDVPSEAHVQLNYTVQSVSKTVPLKVVQLAPREVKVIEISREMARLGVLGPVEDAGVDITYTHMPGTVIARLTSYDASGDYTFDVPVKDPVGQGNGGYPWRVDNGYTTVVHLKNILDKEVTALVQLRYDGGSYNPDRIKLAPYQTVAIDIRALRDAQQKDIRGGVMPADIENGQIAWFEEEVGSLIGRAEVTNRGFAVASSFSCGECGCGPLVFQSCAMTPSSGTAEPGITGYMFAPSVMKRDCHYVQYGPYSPSNPITWSSTNTPVVTVDGAGNETTVAPGSAYILARWSEVVGVNYSCAAIYANITASATCDVRPTVVISGPDTVPLAGTTGILTPAPISSIQLIGTGNPPGGTFNWSSSSAHVTLSNTTSDTVTVTSVSESSGPNDVPIVLIYAVNGQGNSATKQITVQKPTYMTFMSVDSQGSRTCPNDPNTGLPEAGWTKVITWQLQDKWNQPIGSVPSYDTLTGSGQNGCFLSFAGTPPGGAVGSTGLWQHEYGICSTACPNGGSCTTLADWNFFANGWQIVLPVTFHCNSITVDGH